MALLSVNHAYSVLGFAACVLNLILVPVYWRAPNISECMFVVWNSIICLIFTTNSIIWNNNTINWSPAWCAISSRLIVAASCGAQVGLLCIVRRLYRMITFRTIGENKMNPETRREFIAVLCGGTVIPLVLTLLAYVAERRHFTIFENIGCFPNVPKTSLSIPLYFIWPTILGIASAVYAALTLYAALKQSLNNKEDFPDNPSFRHHWRLLALTAIPIICSLQCGLISLLVQLLPPYSNESDANNPDLFESMQIPASVWASNLISLLNFEYYRWIPIFYSAGFFTCFGFTRERRHTYYMAFCWIMRRCFRSKSPKYQISNDRYVYSPPRDIRRISSARFSHSIKTSDCFPSPDIPLKSNDGSSIASEIHLEETWNGVASEPTLAVQHSISSPIVVPVINKPAPVLQIYTLRRYNSAPHIVIPVYPPEYSPHPNRPCSLV